MIELMNAQRIRCKIIRKSLGKGENYGSPGNEKIHSVLSSFGQEVGMYEGIYAFNVCACMCVCE